MINEQLNQHLSNWKDWCEQEAGHIALWWAENMIDEEKGGFLGELSNDNEAKASAPKCIVLNSRILWFFSEYAHFTGLEIYKELATRSYLYLMKHFDDKRQGGVYWMVDHTGKVIDDKKQTYAIAFSIYGLSAYYKLTGDQEAISKAQGYFELIEKYARDQIQGGYIEALTNDWQSMEDVRLSAKDDNLPKSQNTHLHVLEAYTTLHAVSPSERTAEALAYVIDLFETKIIDLKVNHLRLFMEMDWTDRSTLWSYGHDIECSWLMFEALEALADEERLRKWRPMILQLADTTLAEGIGEYGQVMDQFDFVNQHAHQESHWWVQAEALVGFLNAYLLKPKPEYLEIYQGILNFIDNYHLDKAHGEWFWLATLDQPNHPEQYKAGSWKAPYHNGRAMMEVCKLVDRILVGQTLEERE